MVFTGNQKKPLIDSEYQWGTLRLTLNMAKMTPEALGTIADNIVMSARENAWSTEGVPPDNESPEFHAAYLSTVESILDSLTSPSECKGYGAERPLTASQLKTVRGILTHRGALYST